MKQMVEFYTNQEPFKSARLIRSRHEQDVVHEEYHEPEDGRQMCVIVLERYYFRTSGRAALTLIIENLSGRTKVRCISAGSAEGIFNVDWGAGKNFARSIEEVLEPYLVEK
ncbi:DUF6054 family protein [Peribacillus kribbensis]|uniref:DUF6054 family protein n=1 Tax=Peribacillus kribbensis TaxID=356658 RepID=UPI00041F6CAC|nr:DUF6054 family protein [Peribacillus kribbensis]